MISLRRHLITLPPAIALAHLAGVELPSAHAQPALPPEGEGYRRVGPVRIDTPEDKIDVVEFFWYGCPHCNRFEPVLKRWAAQLPDDVVFRQVHVPFGERKHQQLYYTLVAMGEDGRLGPSVFRALHEERRRLDSDKEIIDWAVAQGLDRQVFSDQYKSFGVRTAMTRGTREMNDFGVDGVPMIGVAGKYLTAPSLAGSSQAALDLVDKMIANERVAARQR
ncbi:MAG: thiol:disulfide interchange protein DsbA/DsbL [Burkholderiaceae bacterium]